MMRKDSTLTLLSIFAIAAILLMPGGTAYGAKINGTANDDVLIGTNGPDNINAKGGNDIVDGGSGADTIRGAGGQDSIDGGPGNDSIQGGAGDDNIIGEDGDDDLDGGAGNDEIFAGTGNDIADGGSGDDDINGGPGDDDLKGGSGDDNIDGGTGNDNIAGSGDDDNLHGGSGFDVLFAGEGDDNLFGGADDDDLVGNLLSGVNSYDCGDGDNDEVWWDGGLGGQIGVDGDGFPIFADDNTPHISCENTYDLTNLGSDPQPPGGAPPTQPPAGLPDAPTNLAATAITSTSVDLSWTAANDNGSPITDHLVEVSIDGGPFTVLANTGSDVTMFTDNPAVTGSLNTYRVSAINAVGTGSASSEASASPGLPDDITDLVAVAIGPTSVDLTWTVPTTTGSAVSDHLVEVSIDGGPFSVLANTGSAAGAYTDTGAVGGSLNTYRVSAINAEGTGPASNDAAATPGVAVTIIRVSDITITGQGGKDGLKDIFATVTVLDSGDNEVVGAEVTISLTLDGNPLPQVTGTTSLDGMVTFKEKNADSGLWSAVLVDVVGPAGTQWDANTAVPTNSVPKP